MGNQQPKKISRVTKAQIDMGSLKARIHLELMRDRKNAEVIKGQKQLVNKIKAKSRNKTEQILVAERVVNGLKYAQACNQLIAYATSIRSQANFLAENMLNNQKIAPWLPQIYTLIYAADLLGLSSLKQFKDLMRALNDPMALNVYVNPQIMQLLKPTPTPEQLNIYFVQFSERNNIPLEQINLPGHKFTNNPIGKEDSFADIQRKLAEQMNKKMDLGGYGNNDNKGNQPGWGDYGNQGGQGGQGGMGGQGGFGGQGGQKIPGYYDLDKHKPNQQPSQFSNPYGIRQTYDPKKLQAQNPQGPNIYNNDVPSKPQQKPFEFTDSRISIKSINDIDYFPQIQPDHKVNADPQFEKICQILKAAM